MHFLKKISLVIVTLIISACTYIYGENGVIVNRNTDYLKAKSIPPLKIPPGYSSSTIQSKYPISDRAYPPNSYSPDLNPPNLTPSS